MLVETPVQSGARQPQQTGRGAEIALGLGHRGQHGGTFLRCERAHGLRRGKFKR